MVSNIAEQRSEHGSENCTNTMQNDSFQWKTVQLFLAQ